MSSLKTKSFFSTQIYHASLGLDSSTLNAIQKTIQRLPQVDAAGVQWCRKNYVHGYTSYGSLSKLHEQFTPFERLKTKLDQAVKKYVHALGLEFPTGRLELSNLWANVMPNDCYHAFHVHPLSVISGTFYVSVDAKSSPLRIEDPRASRFMAAPARPIRVDLRPKKGEVILFESWLSHEVPPHQSNRDRISVSFNYDWLGR